MTEITPALMRKPEKLWGAPAIAAALGVSVDTIYTLAKREDCPIYRPGGRYFAMRSDLEKWMRTK
ncbi:MAG: helix-turn-helix domain-containing protein [Mesorhizobium sp.]